MSKLSSSIKESSSLQRQLAQSNLNLEAADSSNRILLHELDEVRNALSKTRKEHAKCALTVARAEKLSKELEDVRQESIAMRKREEASTSLAKRIGRRNEELVEQLKRKVEELEVLSRRDRPVDVGSDAIERAKERLRMGADVRGSGGAKVMRAEMEATEDAYQEMLQMLVQESESLKEENRYLKEMLEAKNEETAVLKEAQMPRSFGSTHGAHRRSLNLATSASVASPTTVYSPAATAYNDSAPLGDELMAAAATAHTVSSAVGQQQQQKRTDSPKPALLVSPPSRTSLLPDMPRAPTLASNASDRSSTKEKEGGDDDSEYAAGTGVAAAAASPAPAQTQALSDLSSQLSRKGSLLPRSGEKDTRTQQLSNLLDSVQRLFTRLSTADVNTLSRRLQRQHLTGDVGHLARTTLNSIMRDVEGLREHFRRLVEQEARTRDKEKDKEREDCGSSTTSGSNNKADGGSGSSESLLARREFFALIKTFKDLFVEIGRLRTCVNEVHLQPSHAAKLLQEHLGLEPMEERGLLPGAEWLSKMWAGASAPLGGGGSASAGAGVAGKAGNTTLSAGSGLQGASTGEIERAAANSPLAATQSFATRAVTLRGGASVRAAPRAEASVVSTTAVAVAVAANSAPANEAAASSPSGSTDPSDPTSLNQPRLRPNPNLGRKSLTRVQSRNLSGLFAGSVALSSPTAGGWDLVDRREASSAGTSASAALSANARLGAGLIPNRGGPMQRPLSRIVDDDEVSLHHGRSGHGGSRADDDGFRGALLERTLRPRGLSDSSIHSTFVEHGDASASGTSATLAASAAATATRPSPISRLITASSLALQVSSSGAHATARAIRADEVARTDSPALSEDSASTTGIFSGFGPSASEGKRGGDAVNTSSSSSTDGSKAPSSSTASFFPSLASLRPTASLAILGLSRTGAAGEATGAQSSSTLTNTSFSTSPSTSAHASTSLLAPSSPVDKQMGSSASSTAKEIAMPSRKGARHARKSSIGDQALSQSYAYKTMHRTQF
ncbi:hypothetical protein K437DRAFT_22735 [Tilletiaria anomala UBC 951]|uniref:Uncharacterized protein n=1 Tax=Tilletiaria anomala (strain ATCC 24038 / CBS 436.72 / UBC 951) TaxID=1037660 RepID=A0A066VIU8_TILAU|nr:uncharacterized protein K437DRAFT_22735 [Tilletiaria anomala UBC 951]KDN38510.1 hypothetical protein K437DRAFT_22735 [Tilletiaria anomala UBC 951]